LSGFAEQFELAIGGTPTPGFVLGGCIHSALLSGMDAKPTSSSETVPAGTMWLSLIGPFADFYPDPRGGFHLQGALGPTLFNFSNGSLRNKCSGGTCMDVAFPATTYSGTGFGAALGVGLEGYVSRHWNLGGLLRFQYASVLMAPEDTTYERVGVNVYMIGAFASVAYQ
jgi:hypothetical protein